MQKYIHSICLSLIAAVSFAQADNTPLHTNFNGRAIAKFVKPMGERDMHVLGVGSSHFEWGKPTAGSPGVNSLTFKGAAFNGDIHDTFTLGSISYYNGDTNLITNAKSIDLAIDFKLPGGEGLTIAVPLKLISTPNNTSHHENADIVEFQNTKAENIIDLGGKPYKVQLKFGRTTSDGFSKVGRFHVFEGFRATAEVQAQFFPHKVEEKAKEPETPVAEGYDLSPGQGDHSELAAKESVPAVAPEMHAFKLTVKEPSVKEEDAADSASEYTFTNAEPTHNAAVPDHANEDIIPSIHPVKKTTSYADHKAKLEPSYTTRRTAPIKDNAVSEPKSRSIVRRLPPQSQEPQIPVEDPAPVFSVPEKPATAIYGTSKGQASYLGESDFGVERAVKIQIQTEVGRTYQVQISTNNYDWENFGSAIQGTGNAEHLFHPVLDKFIKRYRVKVTQNR